MLLWGPGLDAELEFRRERMAALWGRPAWVDHVARLLADRRASRRAGVADDVAPRRVGPVAVRAARSAPLR